MSRTSEREMACLPICRICMVLVQNRWNTIRLLKEVLESKIAMHIKCYCFTAMHIPSPRGTMQG